MMFNFAKAAFGMIEVEEANGKIKITAIRSKDALNDIFSYWRTSRIEASMFTRITPFTIEFYSFFAVEFVYILDQLIARPGRSMVGKKALKHVKEGMLSNTWLKSTQVDHDPILDRSKLSLFSKSPLKHQAQFIELYDNIVPKWQLSGYCLAMGTGTGKAQTLSSKIKVPGGWKTMGEMAVGDKVITREGSTANVVGVFPQGVTPVWRVYFEDGRYTDVNPEHLWSFRLSHLDDFDVADTIFIKELLRAKEVLYVPINVPEEGEEKIFPVSPYDIGKALRDAEPGARVPSEYLEGSKDQRSVLLQSITNGVLTGSTTFKTRSAELGLDVQYLVRSLGGLASIYEDEGFTFVRIVYQPKSLRLVNIEERSSEPTQCIAIDHPEHLYLTDDFIVTHNTLTSLMVSEMLNPDIIIMVSLKASIYRVWEDAMKEDYKTTPKYWIQDRDHILPSGQLPKYLIYHMESIGKLLEDSGRFAGKKIAVILDESHKLNEITSQRTQDILSFIKRVNPITTLWASATPIKAYGSEAIPMLSTFDKLMTPEAMDAFKKLYGKSSKKCFDIIRHRMGTVTFKAEIIKSEPIPKNVPIKLKNSDRFLLSTLKADMKDYIIERIRYWKDQEKSVKIGYYSAIDRYERTIKSSQEKANLAMYRRFVEQISKTTDYSTVKEEMVFCNKFEKYQIEPLLSGEQLKNFRSFKSVVKYLPLKVRGECLGNVVGRRREEVTLALIEACDLPSYIKAAEKKTIVFTSYVKAVEKTAEYLIGKGFKPVTVYGAGKDDLTSQVKKFYDDKSANPLVATYQSLSTSVPLVAANVILAINVPFRDYIMEQAIGRIDRINQDAQTYVFKFYLETTEPNISSRTLDILEWSEDQVNQILGVKDEAIALESATLEVIGQYI